MNTCGRFKSTGVQQVWILVPVLPPMFCGTLHSLNASSLPVKWWTPLYLLHRVNRMMK